MAGHSSKSGPRVLGVDPGGRLCGYGVIDGNGGYVASGTIKMTANRPLHVRLGELFKALVSVIEEFSPSEASVEKVFFAKSVKAALTLGHARGVALLALEMSGVGGFEYSPLEVKKAVTMKETFKEVVKEDLTPCLPKIKVPTGKEFLTYLTFTIL